jgi:tRNA modification GTPase
MSLQKESKLQTNATLDGDTIVAIATAPGRGGVGIVRVSGPKAQTIGEMVSRLKPVARHAHFTPFYAASDTVLDSGITLFFPAPNSFTGEDVIEFQAHGGPVVLDLLVKECCSLGARPARAGEFTERAYLNDKIDLTQAEAIADLISSTTEKAAKNASQSLQGSFSKEINRLISVVTELRIFVEAAIDFPEEEIDFIEDGRVLEKLLDIMAQLQRVQKEATQGRITQEGMKLVIVGKPNAGKSSLLNALSGQDTAIVTSIEGTTRDSLREHIQIDGMPLHIVDTAGLRDSEDPIEKEGIKRAWKEMKSADRILLLIDKNAKATDSDKDVLIDSIRNNEALKNTPLTIIHNKCDLSGTEPSISIIEDRTELFLSAKTGAGIDILRKHLKACMGYGASMEGRFSARRRHLQSLDGASVFLEAGHRQLTQAGAGELLAEDLKQCQNSLGEITGAVSSDELLGKIFSSFCIGK